MDFTDVIEILIIDSDNERCVRISNLLKATALRIKSCRQIFPLHKAEKQLRSRKTDIVFLKTGEELTFTEQELQLLRSFNPGIPLILIVSPTAAAGIMDLLDGKVQDYIYDDIDDPLLLKKTIISAIRNKNTSEALRFSNERYELVSKATNDMVWDWDLLNNKVFRSAEGWDKVFGKSENGESTMPDSWWDRVHPDDREKSNNVIESILKDRSIEYFEIECRILKNDGMYATIVDRGYVVRNDYGDVIRLIGATQNITDKKIAEEELRRLSKIAQETINAVAITDADGNIRWINESFEKITGYDKNEIEGINFAQFFRNAGAGEVYVRYIRKKINAHKPFEAEITIITREGKKKWLKLQCQPQYGEKERSFFAVITDVSNDKEAEEKLRKSEKRFRNIIEKSSEGMALIDKEGVVLEMSRSGKKILGYSTEEEYAAGKQNFIYPDDVDAVELLFTEVKSIPDHVKRTEYRFQKQNGEYIWVESAFHNLLHEPEIGAVVIHFRDISSRKHFEQVLKNSEENYRNLFNNNPSAIFIWNPADLSIIEMNDAALKEYGYTRKELVKIGMKGLFVKNDLAALKALSKKMLEQENYKSDGKWVHITKSGKLNLMEITYRGIDYYGKRAGLAIVNNITEKTELEEKLKLERRERQNEITGAVITAQEQEREELGKELHDNINQILATSKLYIEYALANEDKRDGLIRSAKGFIESAVAEIRALSKSLVPPSLGEVGLKMALDELVKTVEPVNEFNIKTEWDVEDENKISESLKLTIFRIIQEQLTNISKHAHAAQVIIKIKESKKELVVAVNDDGKGFDVNKKRTGVGLKNILSRAYLHNGKLKIDAQKGKGCRLSVAFKL